MSTETKAEVPQEVQFEIPPELRPRVHELITEDDAPVDNMFSAMQQRLLVEPLYSSWRGGDAARRFIATSNVGLFAADRNPATVPDTFLSFDVELPADLWEKGHRSYFYWLYGKPPEIAIEIVSNTKGGELSRKLVEYARLRIFYYVVFDPVGRYGSEPLRIFELSPRGYHEIDERWIEPLGLGLTIWRGVFEQREDRWLRWADRDGQVILTGAEGLALEQQRAEEAVRLAARIEHVAEAERLRADAQQQRADAQQQRADAQQQRAEGLQDELERLRAQLRAAGVDPSALP
jgi:Uma2 family endonuclease